MTDHSAAEKCAKDIVRNALYGETVQHLARCYLARAKVARKLHKTLQMASDHLDFCCYGDEYERECAETQGLEKKIGAALRAAKENTS